MKALSKALDEYFELRRGLASNSVGPRAASGILSGSWGAGAPLDSISSGRIDAPQVPMRARKYESLPT